jgi:phosphoglycerate-specific signal transduction histidine kinase
MSKRRKQAIILLALSGPMMWFGFSSFLASGTSSTALAMGIAISCTLGLAFALSGLIMMATKNSLGIWNSDDKGRGEILASQTSKDSPIPDKIINKPSKKVNEMAKANTSVDLMKREKKLETRRKELESLLAEVTKEEKAVEKELKSKGWVQQKDGSWSIE